ncbi:DNA adenine methylase, partial [Staphylococcus hominis]|uniref:DNA adenine methylase n=1 Tax=Staphylococcus hominis TaxID=1290 RepID=UPI0016432416
HISTPALFIYLNKHPFNPLFRLNKKRLFSLPWNKREYLPSYNKQNILHISTFLHSPTITTTHFQIPVQNLKQNHFLFFHTPYPPLNPTTFIPYHKPPFTIEQHQTL